MGKKISDFLKGEIFSSIFYILFGLCLVAFTEVTVNIICKVVFGLVMIGVGIYHIYIYAGEKDNATILDLFTGVIVFVLGGFLFFTPQIIVKILPYLLGAFVLVDSIWTLKGTWRLKKLGNTYWKALLIGSILFIGLGLFVIVYPFTKMINTVIFAGCVMLADGISDIVFLILLRKGIKKGLVVKEDAAGEPDVWENAGNAQADSEVNSVVNSVVSSAGNAEEKADVPVDEPAEQTVVTEAEPESFDVDEGEEEDDLKDEVIINGRWRKAEEELVSPAKEMEAINNPEPEAKEPEEEVLEEWKD